VQPISAPKLQKRSGNHGVAINHHPFINALTRIRMQQFQLLCATSFQMQHFTVIHTWMSAPVMAREPVNLKVGLQLLVVGAANCDCIMLSPESGSRRCRRH